MDTGKVTLSLGFGSTTGDQFNSLWWWMTLGLNMRKPPADHNWSKNYNDYNTQSLNTYIDKSYKEKERRIEEGTETALNIFNEEKYRLESA